MKGRSLVIAIVIATIFVGEFVLRTDAASTGDLVSPSATPRKRPKTKHYTSQPDLDANASRSSKSSKARTETVSNNETITIGRKPKTGTTAHRTSPNVPTTPLKPKKIKHFIGGSDDGSSIRPAGAATTAPRNTPANVNLRKTKQDIEVENDETHVVGHDRKKRVGSTNKSTVKPKRH